MKFQQSQGRPKREAFPQETNEGQNFILGISIGLCSITKGISEI